MTGREPPMPSGYEFVRRLGAGAFGEVVLARHVQLGRLVAIKRILPHALANAENVERFRREAQVLAATNCPSVVQVFDLRTDEANGAALIMENVPGESLSDVLSTGPLNAAAGLRILRDVAEALRSMAEHDIVHRDVKPGNVFVLPDGHAKLGDFGLARALADTSAFRTAGGAASGTPAYFPPEVSLGRSEPDARSDAYSFAVMAYEVLTGHRPFEAPDSLAMIAAHWDREPRPPADALPGIPPAASAALLSGLDKTPAHRPLPHELVERLARIPVDRWPAQRPRPLVSSGVGRSDPTIVQPGFTPTPAREVAPLRATPRPRIHLRRWLAPAAAVAVVLVAGAVVLPRDSAPQLQVESVVVDVKPSAQASCPRGEFVFSAAVHTNGGGGKVTLNWVRPDGVATASRTVDVSDGQRQLSAQLHFTVQGDTPLDGEAVLEVTSPNPVSGSQRVSYVCN